MLNLRRKVLFLVSLIDIINIADINAKVENAVVSQVSPSPSSESEKFKEKNEDYAEKITHHYFKNNFFFFVSVFCAIIGGAKDHCIILTFLVLFFKLGEIVGLYFGYLWICYITNTLTAIVNYVNIITAIDFVNNN
jgi:hypothetical protein